MFLVATFSTFRTLCCSFPFINRKKKMTMHREKKKGSWKLQPKQISSTKNAPKSTLLCPRNYVGLSTLLNYTVLIDYFPTKCTKWIYQLITCPLLLLAEHISPLSPPRTDPRTGSHDLQNNDQLFFILCKTRCPSLVLQHGGTQRLRQQCTCHSFVGIRAEEEVH